MQRPVASSPAANPASQVLLIQQLIEENEWKNDLILGFLPANVRCIASFAMLILHLTVGTVHCCYDSTELGWTYMPPGHVGYSDSIACLAGPTCPALCSHGCGAILHASCYTRSQAGCGHTTSMPALASISSGMATCQPGVTCMSNSRSVIMAPPIDSSHIVSDVYLNSLT